MLRTSHSVSSEISLSRTLRQLAGGNSLVQYCSMLSNFSSTIYRGCLSLRLVVNSVRHYHHHQDGVSTSDKKVYVLALLMTSAYFHVLFMPDCLGRFRGRLCLNCCTILHFWTQVCWMCFTSFYISLSVTLLHYGHLRTGCNLHLLPKCLCHLAQS